MTKIEKTLDGTVSRKKMDLLEALGGTGAHAGNLGSPAGKVAKVRRKLRVCVWSEMENLEPKAEGEGDETLDKKSQWMLKISGKLVNVS